MALTYAQQRLMTVFAKTGIATVKELKLASPQWRVVCAKLMTLGLVEQYGECYALTTKGGQYMPEVLGDNIQEDKTWHEK